MRELLFKNLKSDLKKRKIISSSETMDKEGVRNVVRRHFVYIVKEVTKADTQQPKPYLYVLKKRDRKNQLEQFFCRMKGSICLMHKRKVYLIIFMHSLKITLTGLSQPTQNTPQFS